MNLIMDSGVLPDGWFTLKEILMAIHKIEISGMNCGHCVMAVKKELSRIEGVTVRDVQIGSAEIETESGTMPLEAVRAAVAEAGFELIEP
jgi:copper chaperone